MSTLVLHPAERFKPLRAVRELALMATLFVVYRQIRFLTRDDTAEARTNARRVVDFERSLGVFSERAVQDAAMHSETLITLLNRYYVTVHFPLTAVYVVWVLVRHPAWYTSIRTWFVTVTASALAIHVAFPLAPPRMLVGEGFVDTLRAFGPSIYSSDTERSMANQFAAMPSLHFGWALMVAVGFVAIKRSRRSLIAFAHPLITLLAIVATANHYWLDAAVAFVLVVLSIAVAAFTPVARRAIAGLSQPEHALAGRAHPEITTNDITDTEEHNRAHDHHQRRPYCATCRQLELDEPAVAAVHDRPAGDHSDRRPHVALAGTVH